jgi:hypothetical protein
MANDYMLYLTKDGKAIWNLSYRDYTVALEKGTTNRYGLRMVRVSPKVPTDIEETSVENGDAVRKVLMDNQVFIIRNGAVYTTDGQLVK